ncbi:MAG TPA: pantoate--beta-alanine ligase [Xanthobacteraceae bacterium]|jgi:pantoate--beta-alanine ligase|nr:pantoate--beta-alanine ligase [Xanthobacteraceae bacterium]
MKRTSAAARPRIIKTLQILRGAVANYRASGESIALVPTMGALHEGHLALIRAARRKADRVIVSIFVNPTQFAPGEDFQTYPRTFEADLAALTKLNTEIVWAPPTEVMYPKAFATKIEPAGPAVVGLEDAIRPHFFGGVATVVTKLLTQCLPDYAMFGEKDYQQLRVVTQTTQDLNLPMRIIGVPTVREKDGLAMSSRNVYLTPDQRQTAPTLYRVLKFCCEKIAEGRPIASILSEGREAIERAGFALDYLEARHAENLGPISSLNDGPVRLLVAAKIGATRLIDNMGVKAARGL